MVGWLTGTRLGIKPTSTSSVSLETKKLSKSLRSIVYLQLEIKGIQPLISQVIIILFNHHLSDSLVFICKCHNDICSAYLQIVCVKTHDQKKQVELI